MSRLVEEVKQKCSSEVQLQTEDVYMATTFQDFIQMFVRKLRGEDQEEELVIDYVSVRPAFRFLIFHHILNGVFLWLTCDCCCRVVRRQPKT